MVQPRARLVLQGTSHNKIETTMPMQSQIHLWRHQHFGSFHTTHFAACYPAHACVKVKQSLLCSCPSVNQSVQCFSRSSEVFRDLILSIILVGCITWYKLQWFILPLLPIVGLLTSPLSICMWSFLLMVHGKPVVPRCNKMAHGVRIPYT